MAPSRSKTWSSSSLAVEREGVLEALAAAAQDGDAQHHAAVLGLTLEGGDALDGTGGQPDRPLASRGRSFGHALLLEDPAG
jgi:hypothetical protein